MRGKKWLGFFQCWVISKLLILHYFWLPSSFYSKTSIYEICPSAPQTFQLWSFFNYRGSHLLNKIGKKSGLNLTNHLFMPKIQFKPLKVVVSLIKSNFYFSKWNLKGFHWKKPWNIKFHFIKIGKNLSTIEEFQVKHLSKNLYLYLITNWFLAKPFKYGGSFNYRVFMYGGLTVFNNCFNGNWHALGRD